ncbi:MAG: leucine-rich repeat protein [Clostridia bacterium]|nr:leucine-rich repeat protein [Clostridia bacterium]
MRRIPLFLALLLLLSVCFAAQAEELTYDEATKTYSVTFPSVIPGREYALIVMKSGAEVTSLQESEILFIDQITAQSDVLSAAFIQTAFSSCDVYLGGVFSDSLSSPRKLGEISAPEEYSLQAPAMLSVIDEEAFSGSAFTHIYLGDKVTSIGKRAFSDCVSLVYIYIPASVSEIAEDAFEGSSQVKIGCTEGSSTQAFAVAHGLEYTIVAK